MPDIISSAENLAQAGRVDEAFPVLLGAAEAGDAEAMFELGFWRVSGNWIRRDLVEARDWFGRAARAGHSEARTIYVAMLANGAGGLSPAWGDALLELRRQAASEIDAGRQLALIEQMSLDENGNPLRVPAPELLSSQPEVNRVPDFMTQEECDYLAAFAAPFFEPAKVQHPTLGHYVRDPVRRSSSASFPFISESPFLHALNRRIAALSQTDYRQGEPLQVLRYAPGDEYRSHLDAIAGEPNQRVLTCLVYLTEDYKGGETRFPSAGLSFRGGKGEALLFRNADSSGVPDALSIHAGLPVRSGTKIILSKWIRARPLNLKGPPGRPF